MSSNSENNLENQEIDLFQISKIIGRFFNTLSTKIFQAILFLKRNAIIFAALFIVGVALGYLSDISIKNYSHNIIVNPNFGSNDYLYDKIDLINSKIKENDSSFLKNELGLKEPKYLNEITIEPIADVYRFVQNRPENFELIKLMAEDNKIEKVILDKTTSKNYYFHVINFSTSQKITQEKTVEPILNYLNNSDYFKVIQKESLNNLKLKMRANDSIIYQINSVLNSFSNVANGPQHNDKLVYYNENTQLNDIIGTKDNLIREQGNSRIALINQDKIIKDTSSTINIKNTKAINSKMKFILPFIFIIGFVFIRGFSSFYKRQLEKSKL